MATDTVVTRRELASIAADVDSSSLDTFVEQLPAVRVVPAAIRVKELRRALQRMEDLLETRVGMEQLVGREGWRDPESGDQYEYAGTPTWEVSQPDSLRAALETAGATKRDLAACFEQVTKISHTGLNRLRDAKDEYGEIIRDFRIRKFGPKHLRKREEER